MLLLILSQAFAWAEQTKCESQVSRVVAMESGWLQCRGIQVGSFSYISQPLGLGAAGGNQFDITLRAVDGAPPHSIVAAVEALKADGFVNYFGLQRFGSDNSATHL